MLFKFSVFLFVALVSTAPQNFNEHTVQNELNKITQVVKTSLLNREPSRLAEDIIDDRDGAIANFLNHAMENYNTWLANVDPLNPDPAEITLNSTLLIDHSLADLDAVLKISNQYIVNHSKPSLESSTTASSNESISILSAGRKVYDGEDIIFGGDYTVNGSMNVSDTLKIPFSGQGKWTLKGDRILELLSCSYSLDKNGYVDIKQSWIEIYMYIITWDHIEFEGLQFNYEGDIDAAWMPKLKELLAGLYQNFLMDLSAFDQFSEHNLPKLLFRTYLQERLQSIKLEEIVSGWQPTTSKPTNPPNTGNVNNIVGSFWVCILTLGAVLMQG